MTNVKDFGAVGDGVTDDSHSIRDAISYVAQAGGILAFPTGIYILSSLIRCQGLRNVSFLGEGQSSVLKSTIPTDTQMLNGAPTMLSFSECANFSIRDMVFDNNYTVTDAVNTCMVAMSSCANFRVKDCALINAKRHMLSIQSCALFWIEDNYLNCTELNGSVFTGAIMLNDNISLNSGGRITGNEIIGAQSGGRGVDIVWAHNRITNFGYGAGIFSGHDGVGYGTHNWKLLGNIVTGGQPARDANGLYPKGIEVYAPRSVFIGNTCYKNSGTGLVFGGRYSVVANNQCCDNGMEDNDAAGIAASFVRGKAIDPSDSTVTGNICRNIDGGLQKYGFADGGKMIATARLHFSGNDFTGNLVRDFSKAPGTTDYTWGDQKAPWLP